MLFCFRRIISVISLFFICGCQTPFTEISDEQLGTIYDLRHHRTLSPKQFLTEIAASQHLLIGEQHDNRRHHQAQFWLLQQLQHIRPQGSVLMEMLSVDQQPLIAKITPEQAACRCLPEQLNWKQSWNWAFYGEIVKTVLQQRTPLVATNLTAEEVQTLMRGAEPLNGNRSTAPQVQQAITELITQSHGFDDGTSGQNQEIIRKMVQIQQFRDRRMAEKIVSSPTPNLLIAGNHHINRQFGVPLHLADLAPSLTVVTVLLGENPNSVNAQNADYYWQLK